MASRARRPPVPARRPPQRLISNPSGRSTPIDAVAGPQRLRSPPASLAGLKRKERDFERDGAPPSDETCINVVVRCRGRNEREVRENSAVVVSTDGVKGRTVELCLGASALANKAYTFDKVFSPAADQGMIFEGVVAPILDEVS